MAVTLDTSSRAHADDNSQAETSFTWNHAGAASGVKGFGVVVIQYNNATDQTTSVTYDGTDVPAISGGFAADTANEPGAAKLYYLGTGVPQGTKAVVVNRANNAARISAHAFTVLANGDTEITGIVLEQDNQALTEENVDDGSPGTNSLRFVGIFSGLGTVAGLTIGANSTHLQSNDPGTAVSVFGRETNNGQGSRPVGYTASTDDIAAVYFAVREIPGGTAIVKILNESIEISEALIAKVGVARQRDEVVNISELLQTHESKVRQRDEVENSSESTQNHLGLVRQSNEVVQVSESVIRVITLIRLVSEVTNLVESLIEITETFQLWPPVATVSNDGWDTGPTPSGDLDAAVTSEDSDYITVTV